MGEQKDERKRNGKWMDGSMNGRMDTWVARRLWRQVLEVLLSGAKAKLLARERQEQPEHYVAFWGFAAIIRETAASKP